MPLFAKVAWVPNLILLTFGYSTVFSSSASAHSKIGPTASQKALLAKKRLSLTDHVGAVSQQAMQKIINRKSLNSNEMSMIGYIESDEAKGNNDPRRMNKMKGVKPLKTFFSVNSIDI